jgi:hypothetical protein
MNTISHREDIPNNRHRKVFFQLVCTEGKIEICEGKWKMTLGLNVQFNRSVINLLVYCDEVTLGPSHVQPRDGPRADLALTWRIPTERERHKIQERKILVAIAWNPLGSPLSVALPKGRTCNAEYYRDDILAALTQIRSADNG